MALFVTKTYRFPRIGPSVVAKYRGFLEGGSMQDDHVRGGARPDNGATTDLKALLEAYERSLIVEALAASGGHQRRTAARLGVLPTTLHEKMKRLGLLRRPEPEGSSVAPQAASRVAYPASAAEGRI